MAIILGVDPGSRRTGFGVIKFENGQAQYIASGCVRMQADSLSGRLREIFQGIAEIIRTYKPNDGAIEQVFMHRNASSALKLGHARGAALVAAGEQGIELAEYSPRQIKQAVVGYGAATKEQVQHMMRSLLNLSDLPQSDGADALAVALCHGHSWQSAQRRLQ